MSLRVFNYSRGNSEVFYSSLNIQEDLLNQYNNKVFIKVNSTITSEVPQIGHTLYFNLAGTNYYLIVSNRQEEYNGSGQSSNIILELTLLYNYLYLEKSKKYSKNLKELLEDLFYDINKLVKDKNLPQLNYDIKDDYKNITTIVDPVYLVNYSVLDFINILKLKTSLYNNDKEKPENNVYSFFNINGFTFKTLIDILDGTLKQEISDYTSAKISSNLLYNKYIILSENAYTNPDGIFKVELNNNLSINPLNINKYIIADPSLNSLVGSYNECYKILKDILQSNVYSFSFSGVSTWNFNVGDKIKIKNDYFIVLKTIINIVESRTYISSCDLFKLTI